MKRHLGLAYFALIFLVGSHATPAKTRPPRTTTLTLKWDPNPEPDIAGYTVYYGRTSGVYTPLQTVTASTATVKVQDGTVFYFAVTAFNSAGLESPFSEEVHWP